MKIRDVQNHTQKLFWCPGCQQAHSFDHKWQYNGDPNNPTVSPSILVTGTQDITDEEADRIMKGEKIEMPHITLAGWVMNSLLSIALLTQIILAYHPF